MEQDLGSSTILEQIIARLWAPDGCPGERKQTHALIRPYLSGEACYVREIW